MCNLCGRALTCATVVVLAWAGQLGAASIDQIEALESRIAELEMQNERILALLEELLSDRPEARLGPTDHRLDEAPALGAEVSPVRPKDVPADSLPTSDFRRPRELQLMDGSRIGFYGFLRLDAIFDDALPNSAESPTYIPSGFNNDNFTLHAHLTRFGVEYTGPELPRLGGAVLSGDLEMDFQNGGTESRPIPRFRHAYLQLVWEKRSLLLGQTWDIISPLLPTVNNDTLMWNVGNLGDRRAQIRYTREWDDGLSFRGGVGLTGAVDSKDLDGDGVHDGEAAAVPNVQARLGYSSDRGDWSLGLWGHHGREKTSEPIAGQTSFDSYSLGLDYKHELTDRLRLQGELWTGQNLSDFRGGIGQGVNVETGEEIGASGGWIELGWRAPGQYSLAGGYTRDDPDDDDVPAGGQTRNYAWYVVNRLVFGESYLIGLDYLRWTTRYKASSEGVDNRYHLYWMYRF